MIYNYFIYIFIVWPLYCIKPTLRSWTTAHQRLEVAATQCVRELGKHYPEDGKPGGKRRAKVTGGCPLCLSNRNSRRCVPRVRRKVLKKISVSCHFPTHTQGLLLQGFVSLCKLHIKWKIQKKMYILQPFWYARKSTVLHTRIWII